MKAKKSKWMVGLMAVLAGCLPGSESSSQPRPLSGRNEKTIEERVGVAVARSLNGLEKLKNTGCHGDFCFGITYPSRPGGDLLNLEYHGHYQGKGYSGKIRIVYSICGAYLNPEQKWSSSCAAGGSRTITGPFQEGQTLGGEIEVTPQKVMPIYERFAYQIGHMEFYLGGDSPEPEINIGDFIVKPENLPKK